MSAYSDATFGYDEPELIIGSGKLIKAMSEATGYPAMVDHDGNPILDDVCYMLTKEGIFPYGE